jgi:hypothetical protein
LAQVARQERKQLLLLAALVAMALTQFSQLLLLQVEVVVALLTERLAHQAHLLEKRAVLVAVDMQQALTA